VTGPRLLRSRDARGASPHGFNLGAAEAARAHEEALEILLTICSGDPSPTAWGGDPEDLPADQRLGAILIPRLADEMSRIELALEEREREDLTAETLKARAEGGPS